MENSRQVPICGLDLHILYTEVQPLNMAGSVQIRPQVKLVKVTRDLDSPCQISGLKVRLKHQRIGRSGQATLADRSQTISST